MQLKETETAKENRESRQSAARKKLRHRVRTLAAVTITSAAVAAFSLVALALMWIYGVKGGKALFTVSNPASQETSVYSQSEVDSMVASASEQASAQAKKSILDTIRSELENGTSFMELLRSMYPDNLVLVDSGRYYFLEHDTTLKQNTLSDSQFVKDDQGIVTYQEDGKVTSHMGIDVSKYQGDIDWAAVKADGAEYAIIRCGVRGYSEGAILEDGNFKQNVEGALQAGLKVGVYFFTQAVSDAEAKEEAQFVLDQIKGYEITCPVYLDVEDLKKKNCRTNDLTAAQRTAYARTFLQTISAAGYQPGIYGNNKSFLLLLDMKQLEDYPKWLASYSLPVYFPYAFDSLQYTEAGRIAGIDEKIDLNISFRAIWEK